MSADLEQRLQRHLSRSAAAIELPDGGPEPVMARALRRRRRQRGIGVAAVVSVVAVSAIGIGVAARVDDAGRVSTQPSPGPEPGLDGAVAPVFHWRAVDAPGSLYASWPASNGGSNDLYAVSTQPGVAADAATDAATNPAPSVLYHSSDGTNWTPGGAVGDRWISSLDGRDGQIYAVGTAPATAAGGGADVVVSTSSDSGASWRDVKLPIDFAALRRASADAMVTTSKVAAGPHGVLAAVAVSANPDVASLLPAGTDARWGWRLTDTGVEVFGPAPGDDPTAACPSTSVTTVSASAYDTAAIATTTSIMEANGATTATVPPSAGGCAPFLRTKGEQGPVAASFTWGQLGVQPDLASLRNELRVYFSTDGTAFEPVSLPMTVANAGTVQAIAHDDGYVLAASMDRADGSGQTVVMAQSTDGRTWTAAPELPGWSVSAVGRLGGHVVVTGFDGAGPAAAVLVDGAWQSSDLTSVVDPTLRQDHAVNGGPTVISNRGAVMVVQLTSDPVATAGGLDVHTNGLTIHLADMNGAATVTDDATGAVIATTANIFAPSDQATLSLSAEGTLTIRGADGSVRATLPIDDVAVPLKQSFQTPGAHTSVVLSSADGISWAAEDVTSLLGSPTDGIVSATATADGVVLVARTSTADATTPARQVALVGS